MRWLEGFGDEDAVQEEALELAQTSAGRREAAMNGVRIDKWLWAARFFKTRALASKACELGRVQSNGVLAKAAREVRVGDVLKVRNEGGDFVMEVLVLSEVRGSCGGGAGAVSRDRGEQEKLERRLPRSARRCLRPRLRRRGGQRSATGG